MIGICKSHPHDSAPALAELALRGCVVATIKRDAKLVVPNGSTRLKEGDVLTLIGGEAAVHRAREKLDWTG